MEDRKTKLDKTLLSCLTQLESFEECSIIENLHGGGYCSTSDISTWEKKNVPYILPSDLKAFYTLFNGLNLSYKVDIAGKPVSIGELKLNTLDAITRVALEGTFPKMNWSKPGGAGVASNMSNNDSYVLDLKTSAAFSIDSSLEIGEVVLLYRSPDEDSLVNSVQFQVRSPNSMRLKSTINPYEDPEVWFQDISSRWHFMSATFTNFLRLMVTHCGIYGWHLAYTPEGLPIETIHWMGLFCKERICVDLNQYQEKK